MNSNDYIITTFSDDLTVANSQISECVKLQDEVGWGDDKVAAHILRVDTINLIDKALDLGYVLIALSLSTEKVIGFIRVTYTSDKNKHWGHELVVSKSTQSKNIGFVLMEAAKEKSRELNAKYMYGTYDPMEGLNGNLYLSKCGACAIKVYENFYGAIKSEAHGNRKTHRFLVCFDLENDTPKVLEKEVFEKIPVVEDITTNLQYVKIEIPLDVKILPPNVALKLQNDIYAVLTRYVNQLKYSVSFYRDKENNKNFLILEKTSQ